MNSNPSYQQRRFNLDPIELKTAHPSRGCSFSRDRVQLSSSLPLVRPNFSTINGTRLKNFSSRGGEIIGRPVFTSLDECENRKSGNGSITLFANIFVVIERIGAIKLEEESFQSGFREINVECRFTSRKLVFLFLSVCVDQGLNPPRCLGKIKFGNRFELEDRMENVKRLTSYSILYTKYRNYGCKFNHFY